VLDPTYGGSVAPSDDAEADARRPRHDPSGGFAALTSLALLVLIFQRHVPEPLFEIVWLLGVLTHVEVCLGVLLFWQLVRIGRRGLRTAINNLRELKGLRVIVTVIRPRSTGVRRSDHGAD
jgi:hypothetical protein